MHVAGKIIATSGHSEAGMRYAHHMGSAEHVPAIGWAMAGERRIELSGYDYPDLSAAQLEAKALALLRRRS